MAASKFTTYDSGVSLSVERYQVKSHAESPTPCERCSSPITGTGVSFWRGWVHVGCTSIQELQAHRSLGMRTLTGTESMRLAGVKPFATMPSGKRKPSMRWLKALAEAIETPNFRITESVPMVLAQGFDDPATMPVSFAHAQQTRRGELVAA